jgi:hypothetical protein
MKLSYLLSAAMLARMLWPVKKSGAVGFLEVLMGGESQSNTSLDTKLEEDLLVANELVGLTTRYMHSGVSLANHPALSLSIEQSV